MFEAVLIANRGEIAVRIARTLRTMGVRPVTVHSEADADAPHVRACDASVCIGPPPVAQSYLVAERVIEAARTLGAQAVHPGYGLLSESAAFASACAAAGLTFVGPPPDAIAAMGDKAEARRRMAAAGVPVVPGSDGPVAGFDAAREVGDRVGYPLLVKASGGGGGIGLKLVRSPATLEKALRSAADRGASSFSNPEVYLERYVEGCHHVEVQVLFDGAGHGVHLFERECSVQRRHQKVVEEAPSPHLRALGGDLAERMRAAALSAGRAIGYEGAGTVEFVVSPTGEAWFIEMNTRLQVEHPVTEAVTGVDLVEHQVRVAAGEPLALRQEDLAVDGWAVEARIYAEDPARRFLPSPGTLERLVLPSGEGVRCDFGYREGQAVTPYYDPMLGKVTCHGRDRAEALARLRAALDGLQVSGVTTNRALLRGLMDHPDFVAGTCDTGFLESRREELTQCR